MAGTAAPPREIRYLPLQDVRQAERNPRLHESLEEVIGSIARFGFVESAVHDGRTDRIIAGHGRRQALETMRERGMDVPDGIVEADDQWLMPVQFGWQSRNDSEAEALLVALNRLVETGGWERGGLADLLDELRNNDRLSFAVTGFRDPDVDEMLAERADDEFAETDPEDLDEAPEAPEAQDAISELGDVWTIGRHRLIVGDSTSAQVVERLLDGHPAQMAVTDPPYGVSYVGQRGMRIINDDLKATELGKMLLGMFRTIHTALKPGGAFYVCSPSGNLETEFRLALREVGLAMRTQIVWVKDSLVLGRADYHGQHETILYGWQLDGEPEVPPHFDPEHDTVLYGWKDGAAHTFDGGRKQTTVWRYPKPKRSDLHPTMKPVAMIRRAITNSSKPGDAEQVGWVLDVCGGSGTTMVAAHTAHRSAALVELDPPYADVIVQRMHELFGLDAVRERDGKRWSTLQAERVTLKAAATPSTGVAS